MKSHLATPLEGCLRRRYSTRSSLQNLVPLLAEPERYYRRRRVNNLDRTLQNSGNQTLDSIEDTRYLFSRNPMHSISTSCMVTPLLDNNYKPLDLSTIVGASHDISDKTIEKLLVFQGNNAIITQDPKSI